LIWQGYCVRSFLALAICSDRMWHGCRLTTPTAANSM
jgi:hypothetical protein